MSYSCTSTERKCIILEEIFTPETRLHYPMNPLLICSKAVEQCLDGLYMQSADMSLSLNLCVRPEVRSNR